MKLWIIVAIVGLLALSGVAAYNSFQEEKVEAEVLDSTYGSCDGSCSGGDSCTNSACGAKRGKSCGCSR